MPPLTGSAPAPLVATAFSLLSDGLRAVVATAHSGKLDRLWAEIEHYLTSALWAESAHVLVHAGGAWRRWDFTQHESQLEKGVDQVPNNLVETTAVIRSKEAIFMPIVRGAVCAAVHRARVDTSMFAALDLVAASLGAAVATCEKQMVAAQNLEDVQALQRVATRILKSHDLTEIMQLITLEAKRLLLSDICGIMLREDDAVVMKRCVGNYSLTTASLRMKPGQGIAGQVFATMQPCRVDDYLASHEISRDFFTLAQDEGVRSALAAPLLSHDEVIGVLEVWRRRPSTFTDLETTRLVALANLGSIAIENAQLHAVRQRTLQELERSNEALNTRYEEVRNLVALTEDLVRLLLSERGIGAIAQRAAEHLAARVFLTDKEYRVHGSSGESNLPADLQAALIAARSESHEGDERAFTFGLGPRDNNCIAQGIFIAKELVGFVIVASEHAIDASTSLAVGQIVLATALFVLEQRAVSRARSETLDAIVWDLLEGHDELRRTAIDRLHELKLKLPSPLRVVLITFNDSETVSDTPRIGSAKVEERRRLVRDAFLASQSALFKDAIVGARGNTVAALIADDSAANLERSATRIVRKLAEHAPSLVVLLGTSAPCESPESLPTAYRDSRTSVDVARQRGHSGAIVFERSGVVGLLFSVKQEGGIRGLLDATFGRLMQEDQRNRQQLLDTLRVYFDVNYSQEAAAQRLGVHRKTISYRLAKIADLTGLDLSTHEDRLLADLALYIRSAISSDTG